MRLTGTTVRDRVRQVSLPRRTAKDGLNKGTVAVDIRHHHHDIAWRQFGIVLQHRQQLVVKHFDLTLRAMANMDRDAAIVRIQLSLAVAAFELVRRHAHDGTVFQIQNI
jgi:hypothetical protein